MSDQLLITMGEDDFEAVMRPKITGTRVLHDAFSGHDLDFFVMFGSAGSTIAAPGQGTTRRPTPSSTRSPTIGSPRVCRR